MTDKVLEILIGVPASGKSTWILKNRTDETVIISSDTIVECLAEEMGGTYDKHFSELIGKATGMAKKDFRDAIEHGISHVVVDRTNLTPASRKKWIAAAKELDYKIVARVFPTPPKDILAARLTGRPGKNIPDDVMENMKRNFRMPREIEGFDEINMENTGG